MSIRGTSTKRTICEVLRVINDHHQENTEHDEFIRKLLAEAEAMAKRMSYKMKEYNEHWDKGWWEANPTAKKDLERRLKETYCTGEINDT